jgi:hypothetical protein
LTVNYNILELEFYIVLVVSWKCELTHWKLSITFRTWLHVPKESYLQKVFQFLTAVKVFSPDVFLLTILQNVYYFYRLLIFSALLPSSPVSTIFPHLFFVFSFHYAVLNFDSILYKTDNVRVTFIQALSFNHSCSGRTVSYIFWVCIYSLR